MYPFMDAHCDTITKLCDKKLPLRENQCHIDVRRLWETGCALQFFAIWLDPFYYAHPLRHTLRYIDYYYQELEKNKEELGHLNTKANLEENLQAGKTSALLSLEGGEALEGDISVLHMLHRLGVRGITLTWNNRNALGEPASHGPDAGGLTPFGREVVTEMNRLGMVVDVSHLSDNGFWDVAMTSSKPFIASHSNARAICPSSRNLTDEQIRALAERGGVMGLNLYSNFLTTQKQATSEDVLRHVHHILKVGGEDVLGFGCDFDGIDTPPTDILELSALPPFFTRLEQEFGAEITQKITYGNFLRVLSNILA